MNFETKDRYFKETVAQLKEWGFEVYSPAHIFKDTFRYGWVTDGVNTLYFQIDDLEGLHWSTEHIPEEGKGCGHVIEIEDLTKKAIQKAFKLRFGTPYRNFEHFKSYYERTDLVKL